MTKPEFSKRYQDLLVREARPGEAVEACDVIRSSIVDLCFEDHGGDRGYLAVWLANKTPDNLRAWIAQSHVFVAQRGTDVVGVAALSVDGEITLNYVLPAHRFTGVSRALLYAVEERARDLGFEECRLESTRTALTFYRAAGYEEFGGDPRRSKLAKRL